MSQTSDLQEWLELRAVKGLGPTIFARLLARFGSPSRIRQTSQASLMRDGGIPKNLAFAIHQPSTLEVRTHIQKELQAVKEGQLKIITLSDPTYPKRLKTLPDPPPLLYMKGSLLQSDDHALAMVGARNSSVAAREVTRRLSGDLAALGFTIISGLARGIDASAHEGALTVTGGRTIAVLGCGIDRIYPPEHKGLSRRVSTHGALISEFSMGTPPHSFHFPQRNRLISGLSLGVIISQATLKSGSLITARLALDQNREVFAIPGPITDPRSQGPHALIKQGAKLVEETTDVVEEILPMLEPTFRKRWDTSHTSPSDHVANIRLGTEEKQVFNLITSDPISLDNVISQGPFSPSEVMSILLSLEIKGLIKQITGLQYIRTGVR